MIDQMFWSYEICDICRKDQTLLEPRLAGIMEDGKWVDGFSQEKVDKAKEIMYQWEKEITCPCITFWADMEKVIICEKHLAEIVAQKDDFLNGKV